MDLEAFTLVFFYLKRTRAAELTLGQATWHRIGLIEPTFSRRA